MIMNFFSPMGLVSFIDPVRQKLAKACAGSCQSTKIDPFLGQIPQKFDSRFLPNFPGEPNIFFKILTTGTKGSIIPKSEGVSDVRD